MPSRPEGFKVSLFTRTHTVFNETFAVLGTGKKRLCSLYLEAIL